MGDGRMPASTGNRDRTTRKGTRSAYEQKLAEQAAAEHERKMKQAEAWSEAMKRANLAVAGPTEAARIHGYHEKDVIGAFRAGVLASKRGSWGGDLDNAEIGYGQSAARPTQKMMDAYTDGWVWYATYK